MASEAVPGELLDRVERLSAQLDEVQDAHARELAEELVAAVIAMYGDGLHRIIGAIASSREAGATILDELAQDGAVASLLLIHDLYPVPLAERVVEALDTVRPYMESHGGNVELLGLDDGVATLAAAGKLQRLCGLTRDAGARDQAGARRTCPGSRWARGGGHHRSGRERPRAADGCRHHRAARGPFGSRASCRSPSDRPARWVPIGAVAGPGPGAVQVAVDRRSRALARQRRRLAAGLSRRVRLVRRAAARRRAPRADAPLRELRGRVRPAPGGPGGRRRAAAADAGAPARVGRDPGGRVSRLDELIGRAAPGRDARADAHARSGRDCQSGGDRERPPAPERCDICNTSIPDDHRHLLHLVRSGGSCARARPAGRFTPATRNTGRRGCGRSGLPDFELDQELWARFEIPIGLAFFMRSSVTGGVVAFYPSPAGATESELSLAAWDALVSRNPVLDELELDAEALVVNRLSRPAPVRDRADRPVLRAGRPDQVALGGNLRRQRARAGCARVLRRVAPARGRIARG